MALLLGVCGTIAALLAWQAAVPMMPSEARAFSMAVRLGHAAAALLPGSLVLAAMLVAQTADRFLAGRSPRLRQANRRAVADTLGHWAAFAPGLLALAAAAPAARMSEVLALGPVFALARLLFWVGCFAAPLARAPGVGATFAVLLATLAAAGWNWAGGLLPAGRS